MASEVQICNLALSRVGAFRIQSLNDATKEARECKLFYAFSRDSVLRDHDWGFARRRLALALLPDTWSGWAYAYQYPSDALAVRKIQDVSGATSGVTYDASTDSYATTGKVEFEIAANDDLSRRVILTDKQDAELIYTARVEDPNMFDMHYSDALAWRLAAELAVPLKSKLDLQDKLFAKYLMALGRAASVNANEGEKKPVSDNKYLEARS